ncbi:hypothetical protein MMC21_001790 [Puttea exsequens]|nr:hypothetical protein [Puttea exsequens]
MTLLGKLVPLLVLTVVLALAAFIGYVGYTIANDIAEKTSKKMERKNVSFGKEGMRIGVKEVREENYVDRTQSVLVNVWNYSKWPAYKSRFWNKENTEQPKENKRSS